MSETKGRRQLIADAAIGTLAREGMRGLTHRAVDQAAGLPEGSSSYYFRTRQALLQATLERLIEVDTADLPPEPTAGSAADSTAGGAADSTAGGAADSTAGGAVGSAEAAARVVRHWTAQGGERMLARYELMLEASRRPELQEVLSRARDHYHAMAERTLAAAGATDPAAQAQLFIACLDGLVFRHLTGADRLTLSADGLRDLFRDFLYGVTRPRTD